MDPYASGIEPADLPETGRVYRWRILRAMVTSSRDGQEDGFSVLLVEPGGHRVLAQIAMKTQDDRLVAGWILGLEPDLDVHEMARRSVGRFVGSSSDEGRPIRLHPVEPPAPAGRWIALAVAAVIAWSLWQWL